MEEQFPAFTVDERACSDPCQIEAQRITVQHESKQNNRLGKKNVRGIAAPVCKWQKQNFILFLEQLKTEKHKNTKLNPKMIGEYQNCPP